MQADPNRGQRETLLRGRSAEEFHDLASRAESEPAESRVRLMWPFTTRRFKMSRILASTWTLVVALVVANVAMVSLNTNGARAQEPEGICRCVNYPNCEISQGGMYECECVFIAQWDCDNDNDCPLVYPEICLET
jgi:hypothetical protein